MLYNLAFFKKGIYSKGARRQLIMTGGKQGYVLSPPPLSGVRCKHFGGTGRQQKPICKVVASGTMGEP